MVELVCPITTWIQSSRGSKIEFQMLFPGLKPAFAERTWPTEGRPCAPRCGRTLAPAMLSSQKGEDSVIHSLARSFTPSLSLSHPRAALEWRKAVALLPSCLR